MTELDRGQLDRVRTFLVEQGEPVSGDLAATLIAGGKSNLTYRLTDDVSAWVLRRPPSGGLTPSAHDISREFRINKALYGSAVPVARPVGHTADVEVIGTQFSVVAYVPGRTIRPASDLDALSDDEVDGCVTALIDTLVALHRTDFSAVGLDGFGRTDAYAARQLRRWSGQWEHMELESPAADRLLAALQARAPEQSSCAIVHGDYRVDNTLLHPDDVGTVVAVVDWELSTLGDPVADVAMMCAYRHAALDVILGGPGCVDESPTALGRAAGRSVRAALGYDPGRVGLLSGPRVLQARGDRRGDRLPVPARGTSGKGFSTAGDAVPGLLEAGWEVLGRHG